MSTAVIVPERKMLATDVCDYHSQVSALTRWVTVSNLQLQFCGSCTRIHSEGLTAKGFLLEVDDRPALIAAETAPKDHGGSPL